MILNTYNKKQQIYLSDPKTILNANLYNTSFQVQDVWQVGLFGDWQYILENVVEIFFRM